MARDSDDLWYHATVVDLLADDRYHVLFDLSQREAKLDANEIFPLRGTLLCFCQSSGSCRLVVVLVVVVVVLVVKVHYMLIHFCRNCISSFRLVVLVFVVVVVDSY